MIRITLLLLLISFKIEAQISVLHMADSLYAHGHYTKAIEYYKAYKNQSEASDKIAKAYIAIGNYEEALKNYKTSIDVHPKDALLKYEYAKLLSKTKKYRAATNVFNDLVYVDNKNPNYHYELGLVLEQLKDSTAMNHFRATYNLDQTHQKAIYKIAKYYLQKRKHPLVNKYVDKGLKVYEGNVKLISLKAQNYYWQQYYRKAAIWFEKLIELGESSEFIHEKLSSCYYKHYEFKKTIEQLKLVLKYNKNDVTSIYVIGACYYELDDFVNAEKYIKQFLALKDLPLDAEYSKLARALNRQKKYSESIETLKKAIKENPDNTGTHFFLLITKDAYYADLDAKLVMYNNFKKKFPSGFHIEYIDRRISELKKEKFMKDGLKGH
ncbi:tetratricopeptide repeat protein [Flavivirga spongiicola]|uniref:Tetratricopeptide repeat protein n=1 Tax=Flavivirga spongiicola TaxID=421621 RepID=A0ABU7XV52_9FLAO|nr:tetratricopeptide repeat protein [Flavivirga sp. MEBiC05379]MDO5979657.1 tetratricopeptide repeat protein [Flavivirga sp. MEBiC05379]